MKIVISIAMLCVLSTAILSAQYLERIHLFPESTFVSPFTADAHAHNMEAENIILTKNVRASMGGIFPIFGIDALGNTLQLSLGASVHFELRPNGQAHVVSNDYYIDYLMLDIPLYEHYFTRIVTGHTSHHLSDNTYERLQLKTAFTYSRDYVKLFAIYEKHLNQQFYIGADYAYIMTIGQRLSKPWILQSGGKVPFGEYFGILTVYAAVDCTIRQDANFAATNTLQFGISLPMQRGRIIRFAVQYRKGLDERGQFIPQHRELSTVGFSIE